MYATGLGAVLGGYRSVAPNARRDLASWNFRKASVCGWLFFGQTRAWWNFTNSVKNSLVKICIRNALNNWRALGEGFGHLKLPRYERSCNRASNILGWKIWISILMSNMLILLILEMVWCHWNKQLTLGHFPQKKGGNHGPLVLGLYWLRLLQLLATGFGRQVFCYNLPAEFHLFPGIDMHPHLRLHKNMQPLACGWAKEWFDTVSNCAT